MALNEGIWDPKPRVTNIKGANLKSSSLPLSMLKVPSPPGRTSGVGVGVPGLGLRAWGLRFRA